MNPYRVALQLIIVALIAYMVIRPMVDKSYTADFEAYCPFGGLQAASSFMVNNSLACSMTTTQIFMGIGLLLGVILVSKLFCSFICPIGSVTEWLSRKGRKLKVNFEIKGIADRLLRVLKYALLFVTFYFSVTSSELFCKTFDPYYAVFSGFSRDVVLSYAALALFLAIPGSFFVRQFWCRYTCPLGAASNIFTHSYIFLAIAGVYYLLVSVLNLNIHWLWLLGSLTVAGVILETLKVKIAGFRVIKINRDAESCTNCKLCDKACPMGLKVSSLNTVKDVDCHLCGDCVASCPEKNTLTIGTIGKQKDNTASRKMTGRLWIPAAAVVVLAVAGLAFASEIHIPTISLKWGDDKQMAEAGIYEQSGLKSIKCFGSSMAFANHMKELNGVLGVEAYVADKSVKIYYDKNILNESGIKNAMFTPVKRILDIPTPGLKEIVMLETAIDKFFDPGDASLLAIRFSQHKGIYALQTLYGEPVHAVVYYDPSRITPQTITALIEEKKVVWETNGEEQMAKTAFKVAELGEAKKISLNEYLSTLYEPVAMTFNGFEDYSEQQLETMQLSFNQAADPELSDMPWYLLSHVSNNRGVVSFKTIATDNGFMLEIKLVRDLTTTADVMQLLKSKTLKVHLSDGTAEEIDNPYTF